VNTLPESDRRAWAGYVQAAREEKESEATVNARGCAASERRKKEKRD